MRFNLFRYFIKYHYKHIGLINKMKQVIFKEILVNCIPIKFIENINKTYCFLIYLYQCRVFFFEDGVIFYHRSQFVKVCVVFLMSTSGEICYVLRYDSMQMRRLVTAISMTLPSLVVGQGHWYMKSPLSWEQSTMTWCCILSLPARCPRGPSIRKSCGFQII